MLTLIVLATAAHAQFAEKMTGPYVDVAGGLALADAPIAAGPGWMGGLGWWFGRYDEAYAIGRYVSIGATLRQDWVHLAKPRGPTVRTAPLLELRKGNDLIVGGVSAFVAGGPVFVASPTGPGDKDAGFDLDYTARAGVGAEFRRHRFWGLTLRLEGGADIGDQVSGQFSVLLGVQFSRPAGEVR